MKDDKRLTSYVNFCNERRSCMFISIGDLISVIIFIDAGIIAAYMQIH